MEEVVFKVKFFVFLPTEKAARFLIYLKLNTHELLSIPNLSLRRIASYLGW